MKYLTYDYLLTGTGGIIVIQVYKMTILELEWPQEIDKTSRHLVHILM